MKFLKVLSNKTYKVYSTNTEKLSSNTSTFVGIEHARNDKEMSKLLLKMKPDKPNEFLIYEEVG